MGRKRTVNLNLPEHIKLEGGTYYFRVGRNPRVRLGSTYPEAMMEHAKLLQVPASVTSLSDVMTKYLVEVVPTKAPRTIRDNTIEMVKLRAVFGHLRPEQVTAPMLNRYASERGAPVRANRELALLSNVYTWAINWGYAAINPCSGRFKGEEPRRTHLPTDKEIDFFMAHASELIRLYAEFKWLTSLRKADILKIELCHLTEEGIVLVEGKKMKRNPSTKVMEGKEIVIAWSPELRAVVAKARARRTRGYKDNRPIALRRHLFCTLHGERYTLDGFDSNWEHSMTRAKQLAAAEGKPFRHFREHDLRAKSASDDSATAQSRLQHTSAKTTKNYLRNKERTVVTPLMRKNAR